MSEAYAKKLQDPRWQRKRLELLQRANFECESCGNKEMQLEIHHKYYKRGLKPFEYPDSCYQVLCRDCHEVEQIKKEEIDVFIHSVASKKLKVVLYGLSLLEHGDVSDKWKNLFDSQISVLLVLIQSSLEKKEPSL